MNEYYGDKVAATEYNAKCADKTGSSPIPKLSSQLRERLKSDASNLEDQHWRTSRALQIAEAHPEFEEFIEMLELIDVGIRVKPFSALQALVLKTNG